MVQHLPGSPGSGRHLAASIERMVMIRTSGTPSTTLAWSFVLPVQFFLAISWPHRQRETQPELWLYVLRCHSGSGRCRHRLGCITQSGR
jgi:hypothetical protein